MKYDFRFPCDYEGTELWFKYWTARGKCQHVQSQCEWVQSSLLFILDHQWERGWSADLQPGRDTNTTSCTTLQLLSCFGELRYFAAAPKGLQGASTTFATKKRQELKAWTALTTLRDSISTKTASAIDASEAAHPTINDNLRGRNFISTGIETVKLTS